MGNETKPSTDGRDKMNVVYEDEVNNTANCLAITVGFKKPERSKNGFLDNNKIESKVIIINPDNIRKDGMERPLKGGNKNTDKDKKSVKSAKKEKSEKEVKSEEEK